MARAHHYEEPIVALDIGTTKVTCFIAKTADEGALQVLGAGYHQSRGVRNGHIADMSQVEDPCVLPLMLRSVWPACV